MPILEIKNLSISYKDNIAVNDVSFEVDKGKIIGFIGADGAGKSSVLHSIAGVIDFEGKITFDDYAYGSASGSEPIKKDLSLMPQGLGLILYENLSVAEHLEFFVGMSDTKIDDKFLLYKDQLLKMAGLEKFLDREARNLSGGMRQKLTLICVLLQKPKLLLLDEPTTGVDPFSRIQLWKILLHIVKEESMTIIVSSAYMQEANYMDEILLFEDGKIIQKGIKENLLESVKPYTYEISKEFFKDSIKTENFTYSLASLPIEHKKPTLESLFYINRLKNSKNIPQINIKKKELSNGYETILQAKGITKKFDDFTALEDIGIVLRPKEITGLFGANGAGKTTLIKILLGLLSNDNGELIFFNKKITGDKQRALLKSKIGYVSQKFALYKNMTINENLFYFGTLYGIEKNLLIKKIEDFSKMLNFEKWVDSYAVDVPMGIKQRFSLCVALLHEPSVLILDEPTSGVDVVARELFWEILHKIKENWNISILISTHYMNESEFCDRAVLLKDGKKIADDKVKNLFALYPDSKDFEDIFLKLHK